MRAAGRGAARVRIADITIVLVSRDPELRPGFAGAMNRFLAEEAEPDVSLVARWGDGREEAPGRRIFESGALWQLYRENGTYQFRFTSPWFGPLPYKVASFNSAFTSGEVSLHRGYFPPDRPAYPLECPLDELLMINLLAQGRGVEVHACGVMDPLENSHLFAGQSGAGKTALGRLWQEAEAGTILSDDRIILRWVGARLWMYGTPWHGQAALASPARAPLTRVCFLRHGTVNRLVPMGEAEAAARLFACSFPPFYSPAGLQFTLEFLEAVATAVPCDELSFVPDQRAVAFLRKATA